MRVLDPLGDEDGHKDQESDYVDQVEDRCDNDLPVATVREWPIDTNA